MKAKFKESFTMGNLKYSVVETFKDFFKIAIAIAFSYGSVFVVIKAMEKVWTSETLNSESFAFINEVAWLTFLILFIWCVDLIVRPIITNVMRNFLKPWEKKEVTDDGHSKANVEEC